MLRSAATTWALAAALAAGASGCGDRQDDYDRERAAWVAAGYPTDPRDMLPQPVPDDQNAARYYIQAGGMIERLSAADLEKFRYPQSKYITAQLAPRLKSILAVAERGVACDACVWPIDTSDVESVHYSFGSYSQIVRNISRLYVRMAEAASVEGDREEAMRSIERGLAAAHDLDAAPLIIHALVKHASQSLLLGCYRDIFAEGELPRNRVQAILDATDMLEQYRVGAVFEAALWLGTYESAGFADRIDGKDEERTARDEIAWLMHWTRLALDDVDAMLDEDPMATRPQPGVLFESDQSAPQPWNILVRAPDHIASLEVMRLGVALRDYRAEHGDYPDTYEMPIDPSTGEPYSYRKTATGCEIRSGSPIGRPILWRWGADEDEGF